MPGMKKMIQFSVALFSLTLSAFTQNRELFLRKAENNFYLEHTVVSKDNFYSIGRIYNVSAKGIASFNRIDMNKGLDIDQKIRIPLSDTNFTQSGNSGTPVYYKAGLNTTLTRISDAYRKVPVESLRYWNQRSREEVDEGEKLIIGFLLSRELPSVTINHAPAGDEVNPVTDEPVATIKKEETRPVPKEEVKEPEPAKISEPVNPEPVKTEPVQEAGYFRTAFEQQVVSKPVSSLATVTSGIFKTSSGWEDGKYYLLADKVEPGTIVKIINPGNNLVVYAKVLGSMSGVKLNEDLDIRISNAAASALQVTDTDKFILKVSY